MRRIIDTFKHYAPALIFLGIAFFVFYFFVNIFNYWDLPGLCYISIDSVGLSGNTKTIGKALSLLKKHDPAGYRMVCRYVDRINERRCVGSDWNIDPAHRGYDASGCYIRGSKIIYVKPDESDSATTIAERAGVIKKYAEYSKRFWTDNY